MIPTIVLTSLVLTHDVVYGHNHVRNASLHKYGPNVCAVQEASSAGKSTTAYRGDHNWQLDNRQQTCGQNAIVKYDCCEGFKTAYGRSGCTRVKSPKNVLETAQELGAREFVRRVQQQNDLYDLLTAGDGGPYTIFVPTDEAFAKMDGKFRLALDSYETAVEILKYHVVPRRIITQNVSADETLNTLNDGFRLRFNKYSTKVETINCVTIIRKNSIAQNGVVHLINTVLSPYSYSNRNLVQIINQNRELTIFSKMLEVSRMHQNLKETFQTLTVLIPTDSVLQQLPQNQLRRILKDETLSKAFVLKHLLPTPVCLSAVTEEHYVKSLAEKHYVKFSCDGTNSVTIQGNCINNDLKLFSNGMLYVINFALSAEEGKSAWQTMQNLGLSEFIQIVNVAGLAQQFENVNSLTVFAPTNKAIKCMNPAELYHIRSDPSAAAAFVDFHVGRGTIDAENIYDGKVVESLATGKRLRLQCILNDCGVEGQRLSFQTPPGHHDGAAAVHVVDKALFPPTISVEDLVRKNESFSLYAQAIDLLQGASTWTSSFEFCGTRNTYFVPTDYAFRRLGPVELQRIFNNPNYLRSILNNHQVNGRIVPSTLIKERHWQYEIQTKNAAIVHVVNSGNKLMVNNAEIIEADIMTTNGLVHIIDDLILI